ncbi:MFS-type transporter SLC18B1-like [Sycon ciliatum]|uniref:MFS-type transporter SLC18B1-like n=1 Tax=Sycon ciliatum TaxID=27933 RepID=UPI0031F6160B
MRNANDARPMSGSGRLDDESEKSLLDTANEDDDGELRGGDDGGDGGIISRTRRILILVTLAAATMSGDLTSMQSFYTTAALAKNPGAGPGYHTAIGGVYSVFMVTGAITLPFFTKDLPNIGSKNLIVLSHFITGSSLLVFASVTTITDWRIFILYSFAVRILLGVAYAMSTFATMTYLIAMYPANLGFATAFQMGFLAIAHVSGVMLGGALYDIGGFAAPFLFGGAVNVTASMALFISLADIDDVRSSAQKSQTVKVVGVGSILRSPWVWVMVFTLLMSNIGNAGVDPVLGPRMRSTLDSPAVVTGAVISVKAIASTVASPFVGDLLDKGANAPLLIMLGMLCETLGLSLIGPAVFVHEKAPPLWQLFVGVLPLSLNHVLMQAASVVSMSQHLEGIGVGSAAGLRVAVASLSRFSLTIGYGLGSVIFTSMVALLGFPLAMTVIGLVYAGLAVLMLPLSWLHHVALTLAHKQADTVNTDSDDEDL